MTIVLATDTRNSQWAQSDSFGKKMLQKMGWKGDGLGKNQQGTSQNLRAVRRAESLGIGAQNDSFGEAGWAETSKGFHGVLAKLKAEHGGGSSDGGEEEDSKEARKRRRKEEKKRKKREEKRRAREAAGEGSSGGADGGIRLPQNKVQAGHARKWREAKDLKNKSAEDMAAIFGVKADFYKQPRDWVQKSDTPVAKDEDDEKTKVTKSSVQEEGIEKDKKESKKKKRKSEDRPKKDKKKKKRKRDD